MGPITKIGKENFIRFGFRYNFSPRCPFNGTLSVLHDRVNISHSVTPLVAAGRYRLDVTVAEGKGENLLVLTQVYGSVSDIRVWF